jgi:N-methylhydantoinase B
MAPIDWGDLATVQSTEVIETRMPLLVESSCLAVDSGGAGRTRGGLAIERALRVVAPDARYSLLSDGAVVPAFGVLGGLAGVPVGAWIERQGAANHFDTPGKVAGHHIEAGSTLRVRSAGGGGYGDPLEREPRRVGLDVREGYVSAEAARLVYGVLLKADGSVDLAATASLRQRLREGRFRLTAVLDGDVFEAGAVSHRRICRLNPAEALERGIGEDALVELDGGRAAPLRAWARRDMRVARGRVPIDARGLAMLRAAPGEQLELRRLKPVPLK